MLVTMPMTRIAPFRQISHLMVRISSTGQLDGLPMAVLLPILLVCNIFQQILISLDYSIFGTYKKFEQEKKLCDSIYIYTKGI